MILKQILLNLEIEHLHVTTIESGSYKETTSEHKCGIINADLDIRYPKVVISRVIKDTSINYVLNLSYE